MILTMDQYERIDSKLTDILSEQGEARTEAALQRQELGQIRDHLARLNGRTETSEKAITSLREAAIEARGAWKGIVAAASAIGAAVVWLLDRIPGLFGKP